MAVSVPMSGRQPASALRRVVVVTAALAAMVTVAASPVTAAPPAGAVRSAAAARSVSAASSVVGGRAATATDRASSDGPASNPPRGIVGQRATVRVEITRTSSGFADSSLSIVANVDREVIAATPGDGYTIRNTIVSIDTQADGIDVQSYGFGALRGEQFDQQANESGAIRAAAGRAPAGLDLFDMALASTTVDLPIAEMAAGATWSGRLRAGNDVVADEVGYQAQLSAVSDNSFTVNLSFAESVTEQLDDGRQFTGVLSGSETVTGRLDNRAAFDAVLSQTIDGVAVDGAGVATPMRWNESIVVTTVG